MKKWLLVAMLAACLMSVPVASYALSFTFDQSQLIQLWEIYENPSSTTDYVSQVFQQGVNTSGYKAYPDGSVEFFGYISDVESGNQWSPFAQMQIGTNFWGTSGNTGYSGASCSDLGVGDLTAYDEYTLSFLNTDDDTWWFNIFMNTGWTDDSWGEDNNYYENGWTEVLPGHYASLTIDLSTVENLDHVTAIGFNIGGNMGTGEGSDPSKGDQFSGVRVNPVPEPSSMLLLGMGLFGFAGRVVRKKRFKA